MADSIYVLIAILIPTLGYIISLEARLSAVSTDIKWIKQYISECLHFSDDHTR